VGYHFSVQPDLKVVSRLQTITEVTVADMLSNDDIARLLAIGERQCAELLGQGSDHASADTLMASEQGREADAHSDGA